jgi:hypothetical protein
MDPSTAAGAAGQAAQSVPPQGVPAGGPPPGGGALVFMGPGSALILIALVAVTLVVLAIAFWALFAKAGRPGALGLLMAIPVVNLGVALWLAFTPWPVEKENRRLRVLLVTEGQAPAPEETPAGTARIPVADPAPV